MEAGGVPLEARGSAGEVFLVALRLGTTSFGGPVAHVGYFRDEYVGRRRWLDDQAFSELVALANVLPGPSSSQLGIAVGLRDIESRAGKIFEAPLEIQGVEVEDHEISGVAEQELEGRVRIEVQNEEVPQLGCDSGDRANDLLRRAVEHEDIRVGGDRDVRAIAEVDRP